VNEAIARVPGKTATIVETCEKKISGSSSGAKIFFISCSRIDCVPTEQYHTRIEHVSSLDASEIEAGDPSVQKLHRNQPIRKLPGDTDVLFAIALVRKPEKCF
jgi:hypothetical protein